MYFDIIGLKGRGYFMKLNASIIHQELSSSFSVEMTGSGRSDLHLGPPQLYTGGEIEFQNDHLYVMAASALPQRPKFPKDAVLVCVGNSMRLNHYKESGTVLCVLDPVELLTVFVILQELYNRFDAWNSRLFELYQSDADIQQYLDASLPLFGRPMFVLNANFGTIASSVPAGTEPGRIWEQDEEEISQDSMEIFLTESALALDVHGPFRMDLKHAKPLCVNLFDSSNRYIGCLWIDLDDTKARPDYDSIAARLAEVLEKVIQHTPSLMVSTQGTVRQVLSNLLEGLPIDPNQRWLLSAFGNGSQFVGVSFHVLSSHSQMPLPYICNTIEQTFPNSVAFPKNQSAVAFLNIAEFLQGDFFDQKALGEKLKPLLYAMKLTCGISNRFDDLSKASICFRQAEIAFENGSIAMPHLNYYFFSSFTLMELVSNSLGGLPAETYYPEGMKKILEHDKTSEVNYLETLRVFLEENMSYSSAARLLYVHRTTLIDRIHRIEAETGIDLSDPNERLHLHLLIKAMELEEFIQKQ